MMARRLDEDAPPWVDRLDTDSQTVADVASQIIELAGWAGQSRSPPGHHAR
jgi:hypothetical protein